MEHSVRFVVPLQAPHTMNPASSSSFSRYISNPRVTTTIYFYDHDIRYWVLPDMPYLRHASAASAHWQISCAVTTAARICMCDTTLRNDCSSVPHLESSCQLTTTRNLGD